MLSIWRLQSIMDTHATTAPTFDPTWYGATPIVISSMEVCLATICASLPVFWPVLKKSLSSYIMVTHEIKVTRESRQARGDEFGDRMELRPGITPKSQGRQDDPFRLPSLQASGGRTDITSYRSSLTETQEEQFSRIISFRTLCRSTTHVETGKVSMV